MIICWAPSLLNIIFFHILLGFKTSFKVSEEDIVLSDLTQFGLSGNSFKLDGFHYHAGKNNNLTGSEHSFDGEFQPMEVKFSSIDFTKTWFHDRFSVYKHFDIFSNTWSFTTKNTRMSKPLVVIQTVCWS